MDSSDQRIRKRKRSFRTSSPPYPPLYFFSVRSLLLCFSFLTFVYLLSFHIPINSKAFRPVLVVSSFSLLSSSSVSSLAASSVQNLDSSLPQLRVENRVLFPDHVLLLVSKERKPDGFVKKIADLGCFYSKNVSERANSTGKDSVIVRKNALSVDEYDDSQLIVRCPLPPQNYSANVSLRRSLRRDLIGYFGEDNGSWKNWENLTYAASADGESVVVFVKGLNLRPGRESHPGYFTCHFELRKREKVGKLGLMTRAVAAAQEVVRCSLPLSMRRSPNKAQRIGVTVGMVPHLHARAHERVILPTVAKISVMNPEIRKDGAKYDLCVCTMIWNQASALHEWIMYHSWLGVQRWFIYDNNSDDGIQEVIEELLPGNYNVTRHVWPWIKTQEAGFSHCAVRAKSECNWVSFMDVDEYFYFPYSTPGHQMFRQLGYAGQNSLRKLVTNFSSSAREIAEIRTSCHSFGPSGLNSPPSQGVTVGYTCRLKSPERHKSIVRPDALDTTLLNVVHHFRLKRGFRYLNLPQGTAVINHYKYQVWEVFRAKFFRRVATYVADWKENQNEGSRDRAPGLGTEAIEPPNWPLQFCEVWDTGLRDFILSNFADFSTGLLPWEMSPSDS